MQLAAERVDWQTNWQMQLEGDFGSGDRRQAEVLNLVVLGRRKNYLVFPIFEHSTHFIVYKPTINKCFLFFLSSGFTLLCERQAESVTPSS